MKNDNLIYNKLINWCNNNPDIFAVILTSSRSYQNNHMDILSDYDIELHVKNLKFCLKNDEWIEKQLGKIMVRWPLKPQSTILKDWITRLIQFQDGTRIDFQITNNIPKYHSHYDAGYKVIVDKENHAQNIRQPDFSKLNIKKPTKDDFEDKVNSFFWDTIYVAKNLWRDELFYAKYMLDNILRFNYFLVIIEWYIGLNHNWKITTNKYGRWIKKYLKPDIWKKIETTFTGASIEENWKALYNMIAIFNELANNISNALGFEYSRTLEENVVSYIKWIQGLGKTTNIKNYK